MEQLMDYEYRCRLGSLGNSSTASGSSDLRRTVGPSEADGTSLFLPAVILSMITFVAYHLPLFIYLISFLLISCASVWETLMREFHISYSHTKMI